MDLPAWASRIFDVLKLSTVTLVALLIVGSAVLFASPSTLDRVGVPAELWGVRPFAVLGWIFAAALLAVRLVASVGMRIRSWWNGRCWLKRAQRRLHDLTPEEQALLAFYLDHDTRTQTLAFNDGVVSGLVGAGVIYRAASMSQFGENFAFNIQPWAWDYLRVHRHLLNRAQEGIKARQGRRSGYRGILD